MGSGVSLVCHREFLEQSSLVFLGNAYARILHGAVQGERCIINESSGGADVDSAIASKFSRIITQVKQNLAQSIGITFGITWQV